MTLDKYNLLLEKIANEEEKSQEKISKLKNQAKKELTNHFCKIGKEVDNMCKEYEISIDTFFELVNSFLSKEATEIKNDLQLKDNIILEEKNETNPLF